MRGFLHIIEIIIISLVMFIIVLQFTFIPPIPGDWPGTKIYLMGNDMLFSLEEKGVSWLDRVELTGEMDALLSGTNIIYDITVENAIKSPILVGCLCSDQETAELKDMLTPFSLNGQKIEFVVNQIDPPGSINFFNPVLPLTYDVILLYDYDLGGTNFNYSKEMRNFLGADKGVIQIRDLDKNKLNYTKSWGVIQRDYFELKWNPFILPGTQDIYFSITPNLSFYNIQKYTYNIPIHYEDFDSGTSDFVNGFGSDFQYVNGKFSNSGVAFAKLDREIGDNYVAEFEFNTTGNPSTQFSALWMLSYQSGNYYFAGYYNNALVIANNTLFGGTLPYTWVINPATFGEVYNIKVTKEGNDVSVKIFNKTSEAEISHTFSNPLPDEDEGLFVYNPAALFTLFDNVRIEFPSEFNFSNFLSVEEQVNVKGNRTERILLKQKGSEAPALIVNDMIEKANGFGRTAWLSGGSLTLERKNLIKALISWAAGDRYNVAPNTVNNPLTLSMIKAINIDFYQPVKIIMQLGYVF
jgi:hypothetical protein